MESEAWPNRATMIVNLWLASTLETDRGSFEITPDYVKELVDEMLEGLMHNGFSSDLIQCALTDVDYAMIAKRYPYED